MFLTTHSTLFDFWLIPAFLALGLVAFVGIVLFRILYSKKKTNILTIIGGGMITGPLLFLVLLNIFSYVFRGPIFLIILFILVVIASFYLVKSGRVKIFSELLRPEKVDLGKLKLVYFLLAVNIFLLYIFVGRSNVGGDVLQYWAIATSFARGNFPTVMPYQPDFLTVYHTGTYLVLGLLHVITRFDIDRVHFFFAFYVLASIFTFATGMALKRNYSIVSLVPSIFGLILFGGPIILTKFAGQATGLGILNSLAKYPTFDMNIGSIGGGAISAESLVYMIQIVFSLAVFLLFVYTLVERSKSKPFKDYVLLILLTNLNLSINEVFFPIQLFLITAFFIYDYFRRSLKEFLGRGITIALIFSCLFFVVQSSTRDSLFTPSPEAPRFQIVVPAFKNIKQFTNPLRYDPQFRQDIIVSTDGKGTNWYLVDIRILILLGLTLSLITQETIPLVLSLSAFIGLICEIFISYTFSPWGNFRFFSQSYQLMAFAFGFLIVDLFKSRRLKSVVLIILLLVLPQAISSYMKVISISLNKNNQNYTVHNPENESLKQISNLLPANSRVLLVSFLPDGNLNQSLSSDALIRYGLIVPLGPRDTKILNIATGIEWFDAATYLDPPSVKKLGVDYVYLDGNALNFLPPERVRQIRDITYFKPVVKTAGGELFKVNDNFKVLQDETDPTLRKMVSQIGDNKSVYLDKVTGDIRRLMFLSLARKHSSLFGQGYLDFFGGEYYMAVEIPFVKITEDTRNVHDIDYAVMRPGLDPSDFISGKYKKLAETKFAYLWKRYDNYSK